MESLSALSYWEQHANNPITDNWKKALSEQAAFKTVRGQNLICFFLLFLKRLIWIINSSRLIWVIIFWSLEGSTYMSNYTEDEPSAVPVLQWLQQPEYISEWGVCKHFRIQVAVRTVLQSFMGLPGMSLLPQNSWWHHWATAHTPADSKLSPRPLFQLCCHWKLQQRLVFTFISFYNIENTSLLSVTCSKDAWKDSYNPVEF